jgi:translocation and assembly module TamB
VISTELSAFVSGRLEDLCAPRIDAAGNVRIDDLKAATDRLLPNAIEGMSGSAVVEGTFELHRGAPHLRGDVKGKKITIEGISPGDLTANLDLTPKQLKIGKLHIQVGPRGQLDAEAEIGLEGRELPMSAEVTLRDLELAELLQRLGVPRSHVVLRGNGRLSARGPLRPMRLAGDAALDLADFAVLDRRFEQRAKAARLLEFSRGRLTSPLVITRETVTLRGARLGVLGSHLDLDGVFQIDTKKGMELAGRADEFALEDFRGHVGPIPWKGRATFDVFVRGAYDDPRIEAQVGIRAFHFLDLSLGDVSSRIGFYRMRLDLDEIVGKKGRSTYGGRASLDFDEDELPVVAQIDLPDAYLHDLVDLAIGMVPTLSTVSRREDVDGHLTGAIDLVGPATGPDATANLAVDDVLLWGQGFGEGSARFTLHGAVPQLRIDELTLRHGAARMLLGGTFGPDWALEMDGRTEEFTLADLDAAKASQLRGPLVATTRLRGVASRPLVDTQIRFTDGFAGKARLGDGRIAILVDGKVMSWSGTIGPHSFTGTGRVEGEFGYTSDIQLRFPDLSDYFQTFVPQAGLQSGSAQADVRASGSMPRWIESTGEVRLTGLRFTRGNLTFENDGPGLLAFGPQALEVKKLALRSPYLSLSIDGSRAADGKLDFRAGATIDGRLFATQVPDLEYAGGVYTLQAALSGTQQAPSVLGHLRVENGELRLRGLPLSLRELQGSVSFSQDALSIDALGGALNNGRAQLTGRVALADLKPERIDLSVRLNDVTMKLQDNLSANLDGDLTLNGPPLEPTLAGSLIVSRMTYAEDLDVERSLLDFTRRPPAPKVLDRGQMLLHYDLDVHLSRGVRIENNLARTDLKGDLKLTGTSRSMGLLGAVNTVRGTAQFRGNEFQIEQGVLTFTDRQRIRPSFDFQASATVKDYKVRLHAYGTPADPKLLLSSDPALSEADLGFLLTFGFVSQNLQQSSFSATDSGLALGVEALNKMTGFSEQVRRIIPKNAILRDPNLDFVTDYSVASTGGSRLEPMARFRSHVVSDKLDLRVLEGLTTRRYRVVMAYQLSDALSWQVQVDNEHVNVATDFGVDLKWRWEDE